MQSMTSTMRAQPLMAKASTPKASRQQIIVCATNEGVQSRRAALALAAAVVIGMGSVQTAEAVTAAKSSSAASQSGYTLEGTKKMGIDNKKRASIMKKARAAAEKASSNIQ